MTGFGRVGMENVVRISISGVGVRLRVEADSLILESIVCGRANNTAMDHTSGIFSNNFEGHRVPDIGGNANPPACFLLGRREGLIRVEVEDTFIESVLEKSGDVLESTMSEFVWDLIADGFVSTYVVNVGNVAHDLSR